MSSSGSLRDLYTDSRPTWTFVPPSDNSTTPSVGPPADPSSSYQWTARPRPNSIYELSPDLDFEPNAPNAVALIRAATASALLQYLSAALENPWEVGKTLLQVQWIPRDIDTIPLRDYTKEHDEEEEVCLQLSLFRIIGLKMNVCLCQSSEEFQEEDSYFADPHAAEREPPAPRPTDERGYVIRQSIADEDLIPEYVLPVGSASGVWNMMGRLKSFRPEGWLALWKGIRR